MLNVKLYIYVRLCRCILIFNLQPFPKLLIQVFLFRLDPKVTKITGKRDGDLDKEKKGDEEKLDESQQREGSNYSLSEEGKETEKIENNSEICSLLTRSEEGGWGNIC